MSKNPLITLESLGQSIWLDYIRRHLLQSGELQHLIEHDGVSGVTSNPAIFEKAIVGSHDYDAAICQMAGQSPQAIYNALSVEDIQHAADQFRPVYDRTNGADGYVSLEVSPELARNEQGTIQEARRLWRELDRPNVLIKVPATEQGLGAIQQLISEGINVNVTLLFALPRYQAVVEAYLNGLEARAAQNQPIDRIASVASFFLSRIDVLIDPLLEAKMKDTDPETAKMAQNAHGQVAIACARKAYQIYKSIFGSERYRKLAAKGARPQRLLWASTSTKNPAYSDVKYVDALIGPETVNTIPMETLDAYRDHGQPDLRLEAGLAEMEQTLQALPKLGIDLAAMTRQLEDEGIEKFAKPFQKLMNSIAQKSQSAPGQNPSSQNAEPQSLDAQQFALGDYETSVHHELERMQDAHFARRFWQKDASLWSACPDSQAEIRQGLGWLNVVDVMQSRTAEIKAFVKEVQAAGFTHVVHMGMGGSSLAPLVFERSFPAEKGYLSLTVLDTSDPETIQQLQQSLPLEKTLFIVASKSGTTAEPIAFQDYFYAQLKTLKGDRAGEHFVAITDPDTKLVSTAESLRFRKVFLNFKDIGGRYSALSFFGLVPAALMGVDIEELLERAQCMKHASQAYVPIHENAAFQLGATMAILGRQGRDKVTFMVEPPVETLGMWLEQLLAESLGKEGRGLLPVANEPIGKPSVYGKDRLFVHLHVRGQSDGSAAQSVQALQEAGHPVVRIELADRLDLGQEFLRWEIATAVAGSILSIDAFNQPNVQESKDNTKSLLQTISQDGHLPEEEPLFSDGPLKLYTQLEGHERHKTMVDALDHWLSLGYPGYYIALMAYLMESPETEKMLQSLRQHLRDSQRLATTLGYGPRFLHSTGQYHKGGPNTGLFLQLTVQDTAKLPIPGRPYDFSAFKQAEALGDLQSLQRHGRRVIRIDLGDDAKNGLTHLRQLIEQVVFSRI